MAEYIDRANLIARIKYYVTHTPKDKGEHYAYSVMLNEILNRPAADVVPVVRCKECAHLFYTMCAACGFLPRKPNDFCSYGERKDGGGDND